MDPLSDVLSLLKPQSQVSAGFEAGGAWSIRFTDQHGRIKCYAVVSGGCWLSVDGVAEAVRLAAGDSFVLPTGRPFRLASDLSLPPVDAGTIFPPAQAGGAVRYNGGGDFSLVGSRFAVRGDRAGLLLGMLPPVVHIVKETEQAALRWCVERMMLELREPQPGGFLLSQHLAHVMLIQAFRLHVAEAAGDGVGWLFALADKRTGAALAAMHQDPARRWTLDELAGQAGMSRSAFALRFKAQVGVSALEYLTRWRMALAADRLANSGDPVSVIALSVGYESEAAFSTAFKRVMGSSPRRHGVTLRSMPAIPPRSGP